MPKGQSLADKLSALTNPTPEFDTQEDEDQDTVTGAKVTEADDEEDDIGEGGRSYLRTANAPNLDNDSRYQGKKIKRKDFQKDRDFMEHSSAELGHMFNNGNDISDEEEGEESSEDVQEEEDWSGEDSGSEVEEEEIKYEIDNDQEGSLNEEDDDEEDDEADTEFDMDISSFAKKDRKENASEPEKEDSMFKVSETDSLYAKGQAVTAQLSTWDKLLEQRILLQKMLTKVNTFPQNLESFVDQDDPEHSKLANRASKALSSLLLKSVQLKNCLERKGVEDSKGMKRSLSEMSEWLKTDFEEGEPRRKERLVMWSDRTQRLGSISAMNTPALEQIEQITSNMARLVKRTQVVRVECGILGQEKKEAEGQCEDKNIFDDSDFYHHLLRELIEKKTSSNSEAGEAGKHWLQIQKLRSKLKKKVDTRASKGRKVRYDIHSKLVNFMAPVRLTDQMPDKARKELFTSLFGARKA